MAEIVKIKSTAADVFEFGAYHADAKGKRKGGVVVIQEIFGIDQYVRADVERWAKAGFEAIAPAMYDRTHPGLDVGHDDAGLTVAMAARQGANVDTGVADLTACVNYLKSKGPVFVVGYCFGGAMTWQAAGRIEGIAVASSYYGSTTTVAPTPTRTTPPWPASVPSSCSRPTAQPDRQPSPG